MDITHFSDDSFVNTIKIANIDQIHSELSYFMWETSTDTMLSIGVPTNDDVQNWIDALKSREDVNTPEVQFCIIDCLDYIENTTNAFNILGLNDKNYE